MANAMQTIQDYILSSYMYKYLYPNYLGNHQKKDGDTWILSNGDKGVLHSVEKKFVKTERLNNVDLIFKKNRSYFSSLYYIEFEDYIFWPDDTVLQPFPRLRGVMENKKDNSYRWIDIYEPLPILR